MATKPEKLGRLMGIGLRVAGRMVNERPAGAAAASAARAVNATGGRAVVDPQTAAAVGRAAGVAGRAAGRGMGGFLRPFRRVGGILWLEVTGFFFGLFAVYFGGDVWRMRAALHGGPEHGRLLLSAAVSASFAYLCVSAFWRARRR